MENKSFFKNLKRTFERMSFAKKIEFVIAIVIIIISLIFFSSVIGWWTVFTSVAIALVYDDIKEFIYEIKNKKFTEDENTTDKE